MLFRRLARHKRKPDRKLKNRIHNYEISTNIKYPNFGYIILCLSMSLDVIKALDIGELAGHYSVWDRSKCRNFIAVNPSRYYLYIPKTASFYPVILMLHLIPRSSNHLSSSFYSTVGGGRSQNPSLVIDNASFYHSDRIKTFVLAQNSPSFDGAFIRLV